MVCYEVGGKRLLAKLRVPYENNYAKIMYISIENLEGFSPKCKHGGNPQGLERTMLNLCTAHGHPGERRGGRHFGTACLPELSLFFFSIYEMAPYRLATTPAMWLTLISVLCVFLHFP